MSAPRVYYAMAKDGLFLPAVARVHRRFGTPAAAIAIQGAIGTLLVWVSSFQQIIAYFIFIAVGFVGLTVAGLFVFRRTQPGRPGSDPCGGISVHPLGIPRAGGNADACGDGSQSPRNVLGIAVVLAGIPVYELFRWRTAAD